MKKILSILVVVALLATALIGGLTTVSATWTAPEQAPGTWTAPLNDATAPWLAWTPAGGSPVEVGGINGPTNVAAVFTNDGVRLSLETHTEHNMTPMIFIPGGATENVYVDWSEPLYFDFDTRGATLRPDHPDQNIAAWFDLGFEIQGFTGHTRVRFNEWVAHAAGVPIGGALGTAGASGRWDAFPSQGHLVSNGQYTLEEALRWTAANTDLTPEATAVINAFEANGGELNLVRVYFMLWVFGAVPTATAPAGQTGYWTPENYALYRTFSIGEPATGSTPNNNNNNNNNNNSQATNNNNSQATNNNNSQAAGGNQSRPATNASRAPIGSDPITGDFTPFAALAVLAVGSAAIMVVTKKRKG